MLRYGSEIADTNWGCSHCEVDYVISCGEMVRLCIVKVTDIYKIASELAVQVQNTSWMMSLDEGTRRSYTKTVEETAQKLVEIFQRAAASSMVASEFGELMVSIGSARALEMLFEHNVLPIAELWKPQVKQNEGFDFHTVCPKEKLNFGEAKFSSNGSPHWEAISQARRFIDEDKHFRDRVHLINLTNSNVIENLDNEDFGVIAAFSVHAANPLTVLGNALASAKATFSSSNIKSVYLVGVINEH